MTKGWVRQAIASATLVLVLTAIVGCAPAKYDGVLWRQVAALKDPLGNALTSAVGTDQGEFVQGLSSDSTAMPGEYWNGDSNLQALDLDSGGLVFTNIRESANDVTFDVLISSGLRNPTADPLADSAPYFGPPSIYTCFTVAIESNSGAIAAWTYVDGDCESKLVATLSDGATHYPVFEFYG